ncbi:MAG TPA: glycerol-3-phosphate dehydrogenase, partial [Blastocatellia bacterium]|nr:glycerol-3-phosphate dehydrogenase [Blastocatellia bacterium]
TMVIVISPLRGSGFWLLTSGFCILIYDSGMKNDLGNNTCVNELSLRSRAAGLDCFERETFDLAVIGGGITGAGIALDAASRGLSVALVEKRDFASGTSSRSSKLIHGGLRYLEQMDFALVREALAERATLIRIAPHLSRPLEFLVPVYKRDNRSPLGSNRLKLEIGLSLYDLLAGRKNIARHRRLSPEEVLEIAPALDPTGLKGGFLYYDCLTDDSRLTIEVIKTAAMYGATVANYAEARRIVEENGRDCAVEIEDLLRKRILMLRARAVVNATGAWAAEVARLSDEKASISLRPSKGIHVVLPSNRIGSRAAVLIPSLDEQRFLFVIPWHGRTLIGTTDTDYTGDIDDPRAERDEVERLLKSAAAAFPQSGVSTGDVISTFAGLRPLVAGNGSSTSELSRKEQIIESPSGLISIIGGKLTTYRSMAEQVTDIIARRLTHAGRSVTRDIELAGGAIPESRWKESAARAAEEFRVPFEIADHLIRSYGGNYRAVLEIVRSSPRLGMKLVEELPHIEAEVIYAARSEMAATVEDFLARRTRLALLAGDQGRACQARVAELLGDVSRPGHISYS